MLQEDGGLVEFSVGGKLARSRDEALVWRERVCGSRSFATLLDLPRKMSVKDRVMLRLLSVSECSPFLRSSGIWREMGKAKVDGRDGFREALGIRGENEVTIYGRTMPSSLLSPTGHTHTILHRYTCQTVTESASLGYYRNLERIYSQENG